jgi:hypothetical protein
LTLETKRERVIYIYMDVRLGNRKEIDHAEEEQKMCCRVIVGVHCVWCFGVRPSAVGLPGGALIMEMQATTQENSAFSKEETMLTSRNATRGDNRPWIMYWVGSTGSVVC